MRSRADLGLAEGHYYSCTLPQYSVLPEAHSPVVGTCIHPSSSSSRPLLEYPHPSTRSISRVNAAVPTSTHPTRPCWGLFLSPTCLQSTISWTRTRQSKQDPGWPISIQAARRCLSIGGVGSLVVDFAPILWANLGRIQSLSTHSPLRRCHFFARPRLSGHPFAISNNAVIVTRNIPLAFKPHLPPLYLVDFPPPLHVQFFRLLAHASLTASDNKPDKGRLKACQVICSSCLAPRTSRLAAQPQLSAHIFPVAKS